MNIIITLADTVSPEAEARVRAAAEATEQNDPIFNGDSISVERGDFTCISEGEGHRDAGSLFALVERVIDSGSFEIDQDGFTRVPFSEGGVALVRA